MVDFSPTVMVVRASSHPGIMSPSPTTIFWLGDWEKVVGVERVLLMMLQLYLTVATSPNLREGPVPFRLMVLNRPSARGVC